MSKLRFPRIRAAHFSMALFVLLLIALLATGCIGDVDTPKNTLAPEGEVAEKQRDLFMLAMWPALVVMILVEGGIVFMVLRWRRRSNDEMPKQTRHRVPPLRILSSENIFPRLPAHPISILQTPVLTKRLHYSLLLKLRF